MIISFLKKLSTPLKNTNSKTFSDKKLVKIPSAEAFLLGNFITHMCPFDFKLIESRMIQISWRKWPTDFF